MNQGFSIEFGMGPNGKVYLKKISGGAAVWGPVTLAVIVILAATHNLNSLVPIGSFSSLLAVITRRLPKMFPK